MHNDDDKDHNLLTMTMAGVVPPLRGGDAVGSCSLSMPWATRSCTWRAGAICPSRPYARSRMRLGLASLDGDKERVASASPRVPLLAVRSGFLVSLRKVQWGAFSSLYSRRQRRWPAAGTPPPSYRARRGDVIVVVGVPDVCLIEVGGTIGDIESSMFLEALHQFQFHIVP